MIILHKKRLTLDTKKRKYYIVAISMAITMCIGVFLPLKMRALLALQKHGVNDTDWAYYNKGQSINGQAGKRKIDINILPLWLLQNNDPAKTVVAVVDTGVYTKGHYLQEHLWHENIEKKNERYSCKAVLHGWDFYNNDDTVYDNYLYDYHGTYIANEIVKVNNAAVIMCCKFMKGSKGDSKDAVKAIRYAIEKGAKIINCSWAVLSDDDELSELIKNNQNILFVCAAGNSRLNLDESFIYPACYEYDNVITVGSINNQGLAYEFGGYGKDNVDILAPGEGIKVVLPEDDTDYVDGTSISAAFVTGVASIIMGSNDDLSARDVHQIIVSTAKVIKTTGDKCKSGGILDAYEAYKNSIKRRNDEH